MDGGDGDTSPSQASSSDSVPIQYVHFWHKDGSFRLREGTDINRFSYLIKQLAAAPSLDERLAFYADLKPFFEPPPAATEEMRKRFYDRAAHVVSLVTTEIPTASAVRRVGPTGGLATELELDGESYVLCIYSPDPRNPFFPRVGMPHDIPRQTKGTEQVGRRPKGVVELVAGVAKRSMEWLNEREEYACPKCGHIVRVLKGCPKLTCHHCSASLYLDASKGLVMAASG